MRFKVLRTQPEGEFPAEKQAAVPNVVAPRFAPWEQKEQRSRLAGCQEARELALSDGISPFAFPVLSHA
jgi:hypothetical protein